MQGKSSKHFLFDTQLKWSSATRGVLSASGIENSITVDKPIQFGGEGKSWSPEHLFLGAISSCYMTTFLAFAAKQDAPVDALECNAIGQVEIVEGKYKFTHIDLYPKVFIKEEALREKISVVIEQTHKYCLVANSINASVFYHSEIMISGAFHINKPLTEIYDLD